MSDDSQLSAGHERRAQPESFRARALGASLTVKDLQRSLVWYQEAMGFTLDQRHEREGRLVAVSLKAGAVRILLNQDDGAKGWDRSKGEGLSLQFTTAQDVDRLAARIREHGGTLDSEPADMPWGARLPRPRPRRLPVRRLHGAPGLSHRPGIPLIQRIRGSPVILSEAPA